jgi:hypothetical protein
MKEALILVYKMFAKINRPRYLCCALAKGSPPRWLKNKTHMPTF